jgi:hypothetical protein
VEERPRSEEQRVVELPDGRVCEDVDRRAARTRYPSLTCSPLNCRGRRPRVTKGTLLVCYRRVAVSVPIDPRERRRTVRKARSLLSRLSGFHHPVAGPGWWEYFGSFGDDFFSDEDINDDTD